MSSRRSRTLRAVRAASGARTRRLPLVAAAVVAAALTAACGPASESAGSAAPPAAVETSDGSGSAADAAAGSTPESTEASPSAPASASASASASAAPSVRPSSPAPKRAPAKSAAPVRTPAKPARTSAAPEPAPVPGSGYPTADATARIDAALRAAKSDGRMVLLDFGANWCGNCKAADRVFAQSKTSSILGSSYHMVKIDIGGDSSANSRLLRKYSPSGGTYKMPVLVVVSPSGTVRTDTHVTGNPPLTAEGLNSFLRQWAS
ncbi:thioredoxin family protein [Streptomyces sp. NPDC086023]|uniref:thioredoxin family protein n=1 Tax=Streptomyces sp. NPDC086023 TaxID=3365746 RepID=UPI0037D84FF4